jgi:hypothetical protein
MSSIVSRIRKLLALAEGSAGNEAEVAAGMAQKLMEEHAITLSHLDEAEMLEADPVGIHQFEVGLNSQWRMQLAWSLAGHCNVSVLRSTQWCDEDDKRKVYAIGYGHRSDLEVWEYLYNVAAREITKRTKAHREEAPSDLYTGKVDRRYMNRYRLGLVQGLRSRLEWDRKRQDARRSQEEGLVMQSRADRAKQCQDQHHPSTGTHKSSVRGNLAGKRDGRSISLSKALSARPTNHKRLGSE